jgi:hypothetical protein
VVIVERAGYEKQRPIQNDRTLNIVTVLLPHTV